MKKLATLNSTIEDLHFVLPSDRSWTAATLFFIPVQPYYCEIDRISKTATVYFSRNTALDMQLSFYEQCFTTIRDLPDDYDYFSPNPDGSVRETLICQIRTGNVISAPTKLARKLLSYAPVYKATLPEAPSMLRIVIEDRLERDQFVQLQKEQILTFDLDVFSLHLHLYPGQVFLLMDDPYDDTYQIDTGFVNLAFHKRLLDDTLRLLPHCVEGYQWETENGLWYEQTCRWPSWDENYEPLERFWSDHNTH